MVPDTCDRGAALCATAYNVNAPAAGQQECSGTCSRAPCSLAKRVAEAATPVINYTAALKSTLRLNALMLPYGKAVALQLAPCTAGKGLRS